MGRKLTEQEQYGRDKILQCTSLAQLQAIVLEDLKSLHTLMLKADSDPNLQQFVYDPWNTWFSAETGDKKCYLCDAGAVMLGSLGMDPMGDQWGPDTCESDDLYSADFGDRMHAIDELRKGRVIYAVTRFYRHADPITKGEKYNAADLIADDFETKFSCRADDGDIESAIEMSEARLAFLKEHGL